MTMGDWIEYEYACESCGKIEKRYVPEISLDYWRENITKCLACMEREDEAEARAKQSTLEHKMYSRFDAIGIPPRFQICRAVCPEVTTALRPYVGQNVILSGATGTGKTSSACFLLAYAAAARNVRCKYVNLYDLLVAYKTARTSERQTEVDFFASLNAFAWVVVDEFVSKATVTKSAQDFLMALFDRIYNGELAPKFWILGNFYRGAFGDMFTELDVLERKVRESGFVALRIDGAKKTVSQTDFRITEV